MVPPSGCLTNKHSRPGQVYLLVCACEHVLFTHIFCKGVQHSCLYFSLSSVLLLWNIFHLPWILGHHHDNQKNCWGAAKTFHRFYRVVAMVASHSEDNKELLHQLSATAGDKETRKLNLLLLSAVFQVSPQWFCLLSPLHPLLSLPTFTSSLTWT